MQKVLKEKLQRVVELVDKVMVDPDIEIEYCIPEVEVTLNDDQMQDPYILVKYSEDNYLERKIRLRQQYLDKTPEDLANLITFTIEQFMEEIDSLKYGAQ